MNKQLLASTALVAAGMLMAAPQASAAGKTVKLGLHGYMEQLVGIIFDREDNETSTARTASKTSFDQSPRRYHEALRASQLSLPASRTRHGARFP